jgi:hypothetical protein
MSLSEWTFVMEIADMWMMDDLRTSIISSLTAIASSLDAVEKIRFARKFPVPTWITSAISTLVIRDAPLSAIEMERLGHSDAAWVAQLREKSRCEQIHRMRVSERVELWNAWKVGCECEACIYGKMVTADTSKPSAPRMLEVPRLKYDILTREIKKEIKDAEIGKTQVNNA